MPVERHRHPDIEQKIGKITLAASTSDGISSPLDSKGEMWVYGTSDQSLDAGTDGFILEAQASSPRGVQWVQPSAAATPLSVRGDLYGFGAAPARVPVGTVGQILTPQSTSAVGVEWVSAGAPVTDLRSELLMQDGVTASPVPLETEAGDDWLYADGL